MKTEERNFNIDNAAKSLPLSYKNLTVQKIPVSKVNKNRRATFKNYNAGDSRCHFFYKPISKFI